MKILTKQFFETLLAQVDFKFIHIPKDGIVTTNKVIKEPFLQFHLVSFGLSTFVTSCGYKDLCLS